mmetsp:Transcript_13186/g.37151  ORF Transcript_13186/g.37151 Transcript_13186/m.37151 type:complete len:244 (-) Transcript_13186:3346-4077(-)
MRSTTPVAMRANSGNCATSLSTLSSTKAINSCEPLPAATISSSLALAGSSGCRKARPRRCTSLASTAGSSRSNDGSRAFRSTPTEDHWEAASPEPFASLMVLRAAAAIGKHRLAAIREGSSPSSSSPSPAFRRCSTRALSGMRSAKESRPASCPSCSGALGTSIDRSASWSRIFLTPASMASRPRCAFSSAERSTTSCITFCQSRPLDSMPSSRSFSRTIAMSTRLSCSSDMQSKASFMSLLR